MLFPPESLLKERERLIKAIERGKLTREQGYRRLLEIDPQDFASIGALAVRLIAAGDASGAEALMWRAIEANPLSWIAYFQLSRLLFSASEPLSVGLLELALRKVASNDRELASLSEESFDISNTDLPKDLTKREKVQFVIQRLHSERETEPPEVTAKLLPYRLIHLLQETPELDRELVDALLAERETIAPLLVGVLRALARGYLPEGEERPVELALAILGEIGDASMIPHLLEFTVVQELNLAESAKWALDRIIELQPEAAADVLADIAGGLDSAPERTEILFRLVKFPALASDPRIYAGLGENLDSIDEDEVEQYLPILLSTIIMARGRDGVELARGTLRRTASLVSRSTRANCEDIIDSMSGGPIPPAPSLARTRLTIYDICGNSVDWEDEAAVDGLDEEELEQEEEDAVADEEEYFKPPEPVRHHETPGRNDPCWCGSGRKYKRCHLAKDREAETLQAGGDAELRSRVSSFLTDEVPIADSRKAFEEFGGPPSLEGDQVAFVEWMIQDWIVPRFGRTVMEEFLRRRSSLTEEQEQRLKSWSQSFTGLHEIQSVSPGRGVTVKNLLTEEEVFVPDVSTSKIGVRWDTLLVRVVETERGREFGGAALRIPREHLGTLREWMEKERSAAGLSWPEYMKRNLPAIRKKVLEIGENWIANVELRNNDGEEIVFSNALFRLVDETAFVDAMNACPELEYDDSNQAWVWLQAEDEHVLQATILREGDQVRLECNSKERLARAKDLLATIAGPALRHLRDEFTTPKSIQRAVREKHPPGPDRPEDDIPPEVEQAVLTKALSRHYEKWIDMPLPALDGQTPRAAVSSPQGRRRVITLLRDMENRQEIGRRKGGPSYDFNRVREALGLDEE